MSDDDALPARLVEEAVRLIGASFSEIVPPEAQLHFLNAQRELLIGLAVVIEHNSRRSVRAPTRSAARARKPPQSRRPAKVTLD